MGLRHEDIQVLLKEQGHLRHADLHRAKLKGIDLSDQDLEGVNLAGADLSQANLSRSNLKGADLSGAKLQKCQLVESLLDEANLTRSKLKGADLTGAQCQKANFSRVRFAEVCINNVDFSAANLGEADLTRTTINGARFTGTDLLRATLDQSNFEDCDFTEANLEEAYLERTRLTGCLFNKAHLKRANFVQAKLIRTDATGAVLVEVDLAEATLQNCNFSQADLSDAILDQASLSELNLDDCIVKGADFQGVSGLSPELLEALQERGAIVNAMAISRLFSAAFSNKIVRSMGAAALLGTAAFGFYTYLQPAQQPLDAVLNQAMQFRLADQSSEALSLYDSVLSKMEEGSRERVQIQYLRAETLLEMDEVGQAAEIYSVLAEQNTEDHDEATNAKLQLAGVHLEAEAFEAAIPILEQVADDPDTAPSDVARALISLSHAYERMGFDDKALSIAKRAQERYTNHPDIALEVNRHICNILIQRGDYAQAEAILDQLDEYVHDDSERAELLITRARLYEGSGEQDKSLDVLATLLKDYPNNPEVSPEVQYELAGLLIDKGETEQAERILGNLSEQQRLPGVKLHASVSLAQIYASRGEGDKALNLVNALIEGPVDAQEDMGIALMNKASILIRLGQGENALALYDQLSADSDLGQIAQALLAKAELLHQLERFEEEEQTLQQIQRQFAAVPDMVLSSRMGLARLMDAQGRSSTAISIYKKALEGDLNVDSRTQVYHRLGQLQAASGDTVAAKKTFKTMQTQIPDPEAQAQALFGLAELAIAAQHPEEGVALYRSVLTEVQDPTFWAQALQSIAQLYESQGQLDEAALAYVEIIEKVPAGHDAKFYAHLNLGHLYAQKQDSERAHKLYQAAEADSTSALQSVEALLASARLYQSDEELEKAQSYYQNVLEKYGDLSEASDAAKTGLASLHESSGDNDKALSLYASVAQGSSAPHIIADALRAQLALLRKLGRTSEAQALQQVLLDRFEGEADSGFETQMGAAQAKGQSGDLSAALKDYEDLLSSATSPEARLQVLDGLARTQQQLGNLDESKAHYETLRTESKGNPDLLHNAAMGLASVEAQQGNSSEAIALYRGVAKASSDPGLQAWAMESQAQLAQQQGNNSEARRQYTAIIERFSDAPEVTTGAQMGLAQLLRSEGQYSEAQDLFKKVGEDTSDRSQKAWAQLYYGQTLIDQDEHEDALDALLDVMSDYADEAEVVINARLSLADLYLNRERSEQAAKVYKEVAAGEGFAEYRALALQRLAGVSADLEQIESATKSYNEILERFPDLPEATFTARLGLAKLKLMDGVDGATLAITSLTALLPTSEDPILRAWAKQALAHAQIAAGQPELARTTYEQLVTEATELPYLVEEARRYINADQP